MKNVIDLIFDNYKDFLTLSQLYSSGNQACKEKEMELRNTLNKEQLSLFESWINTKEMIYEDSNKDSFKCGLRAGARLIMDLLDKDALDFDKIGKEIEHKKYFE